MLHSENQAKVARAISTLQAEIHVRQAVLDTLKDALGALLEEATGKSSMVMTKEEVLEYLEVSDTSLNRYIAGRVPAMKPEFPKPVSSVGRSHRWSRADIHAWKSAGLYPL